MIIAVKMNSGHNYYGCNFLEVGFGISLWISVGITLGRRNNASLLPFHGGSAMNMDEDKSLVLEIFIART